MSTRIRLLPALIGAAGVLLALRLGSMASNAEQAPSADQSTAAAATDAAAAAPISGPPPATSPANAAAGAPAAARPQAGGPAAASSAQPAASEAASIDQAQTKGEAEVLQNLGLRRAALDARERDLALREQLMNATERQLASRLAELKDLQATLEAMLAQRDAAEEAQLTSLVKTYENMKPADAAKIFNKLDRQITLTVAARMKPVKIGAVMAAMDPARAQELTVNLATRMNVPKPRPPMAPPPVMPAPEAAASMPPTAPDAPLPAASSSAASPSSPEG